MSADGRRDDVVANVIGDFVDDDDHDHVAGSSCTSGADKAVILPVRLRGELSGSGWAARCAVRPSHGSLNP